MLAMFLDEMFLKLFPTLLKNSTLLLKEEDRVVVQENVLTPELCVFALVRLGVTKSDVELPRFSISRQVQYATTKSKIRNILNSSE